MRKSLVVAGGLILAGCSTGFELLSGGSGELRVDSDPPGAEAKASAGPSCRTPCTLLVKSTGDFSVTFTLDGYLPQTVPVRPRMPGDPRSDPNASERFGFTPNPVLVQLEPAPPPKPPPKKPRPKKPRPPAAPKPPAPG